MGGSSDTTELKPSHALYDAAKAGFVLQGTTFAKWCRNNNVRHTNAMQALLGSWAGPAGKKLLRRIVKDSRASELLSLKEAANDNN